MSLELKVSPGQERDTALKFCRENSNIFGLTDAIMEENCVGPVMTQLVTAKNKVKLGESTQKLSSFKEKPSVSKVEQEVSTEGTSIKAIAKQNVSESSKAEVLKDKRPGGILKVAHIVYNLLMVVTNYPQIDFR